MRNKATVLFWLDVLLLLLSVALIGTGIVLRWVLPPGSGGGGYGLRFGGGRGGGTVPEPALRLWDMSRHEWGSVHFWIGAALVTGIVLHVVLHFGWIKGYVRRFAGRTRRSEGPPTMPPNPKL